MFDKDINKNLETVKINLSDIIKTKENENIIYYKDDNKLNVNIKADNKNYIIKIDFLSGNYKMFYISLNGNKDGNLTVINNQNIECYAYRRDEGNGHAILSGSGNGNVWRKDTGHGNAIRTGSGEGNAFRSNKGKGHAIHMGTKEGYAYRYNDGHGHAIRIGSGEGNALRKHTGRGNAIRLGTGKGYALREDNGNGYAIGSNNIENKRIIKI